MDFPRPRLVLFSNGCLNFDCSFKSDFGIRAMAKRKRLLSAGLAAFGIAGFMMASQWGHAAEQPAYPVPATPEMMQLLRDEHDLVAEMMRGQLAAERERYKEQRTATGTTPNIATASTPRQGVRAPSSARGRRDS
jgi:hypothetical protein